MKSACRVGPCRFSIAALLLALHADCTLGARIQKVEKPHRLLFDLKGPEQLEHMLGGLLESQFNHQLSLRESNDELGKVILPKLTCHTEDIDRKL